MKINLRTLGVLTATVAIGASLFATASQANAKPADVESKADIVTVFDINGVYSDYGSVRPRITRTGNVFSIDMSTNGGRPPAHGTVVDADTIMVSFRRPDETIFADLIAPGTIRWSNGSAWEKTRTVPNVVGLDYAEAIAVLNAAGFRVGATTWYEDWSCRRIGKVASHTPRGGSHELRGTKVNMRVGMLPPRPCP